MGRIYFLIFFIGASFVQLLGQSPKGLVVTPTATTAVDGKTYALVIGISKYENFPSLEYADRDALTFYDYLRSKAGGSIDSSAIFLKLNENARAGAIWEGMSWLQRRADTIGETAIIYFSGHGDAANAAEAYLLAYDAPNERDANMYNMGGTFQVYNLKNKIRLLVSKGVRVILITDACRTNDLPGKENGAKWTFQSITEEKSGEIQMTSCASNEQSLEDKKWGNGRGVFSYHLVNGLSGLADNDPEDGSVSLYELERYVKDNVRKDTRALNSNKPRQSPVFCCEEKNDMVVAIVDPTTKASIAKVVKEKEGDVSYAFATKKGNLFMDSILQNLYNNFLSAIKRKELIETSGSSAKDYLLKILPKISDDLIKEDLKDQFAGELINEAQLRISRYTRPPVEDTTDILNYNFFNTGALLLTEALNYTTANKELTKELLVRKLFLEARALNELGKSDDIKLGLSKIDSSLNLKATAYGYHTKGLLLNTNKENYKAALAYYDKALGLNPDWVYTLTNKGNIFIDLKQYDSASFYLNKAMAVNQGDGLVWYNMGNMFGELKKYDSAIIYLRGAIKIKPKSLISLNALGNVFYSLKLNDSAKYYYRKALSVNAKYGTAWDNLGSIFNEQKLYDSAAICYKTALVIDSADEYALNGYGNTFYEQKQNDSAQFYYTKAVAINPSFEPVWLNIGNIFDDKGLYDSAISCYRRAIKLNEKYDLAWGNLGRTFYNLKRYDSAIIFFQKAITINPMLVSAWNGIGGAYYDLNQYDSAILFYRHATHLNPLYEYGWNNLGNAYTELKQYDSAVFFYQKAISINIKYERPMMNLGNIYNTLKQYDSAKYYFKNVLRINNQSEEAWAGLGNAFFDLKNNDSTVFCFRRSVEINPINPKGYDRLGSFFYLNGNHDSALLYYMKSLKINPQNESVSYITGFLYDEVRKYDSAVLYYRIALSINPSNDGALEGLKDMYKALGDTLYYQKDYNKAISNYKAAIKIDPYAFNTIYNMSSCYSLLNNKPEALKYLEQAIQKGFIDFKHIETDKDFEWLWIDNEFIQLLNKYKK